MKFLKALLVVVVCAATLNANALPLSMGTPSIYDNAGGAAVYGQTFISESEYVSGVRWYIDDPSRPNLESVNALEGLADLVLFDITDTNSPVELARTQIQDATGITRGLTTFNFSSSITVSLGGFYFIALDTDDLFGLGLGLQRASTYENGYEGRLMNGIVDPAGGGGTDVNASARDTVFEILNTPSPVPEPSILALLALGLAGLGWSRRKKA